MLDKITWVKVWSDANEQWHASGIHELPAGPQSQSDYYFVRSMRNMREIGGESYTGKPWLGEIWVVDLTRFTLSDFVVYAGAAFPGEAKYDIESILAFSVLDLLSDVVMDGRGALAIETDSDAQDFLETCLDSLAEDLLNVEFFTLLMDTRDLWKDAKINP